MEVIYDENKERIEFDGDVFWYANDIIGERLSIGTVDELNALLPRWDWRCETPCFNRVNVELDDGVLHCCVSDNYGDNFTINPPYTGRIFVRQLTYNDSSGLREVESTIEHELPLSMNTINYRDSGFGNISSHMRASVSAKKNAIERRLGVIGHCTVCGVGVYSEDCRRDIRDRRRDREDFVCDACWDRYSSTCERCGGNTLSSYRIHSHTERYDSVCLCCYDDLCNEMSEVEECCDCSYMYDWEDTHSSFCPRCDENHHWTAEEQAYNYKPPLLFTGRGGVQLRHEEDGVRYIGCELEMEGGDTYCYRNALFTRLKRNGYDKHLYFMHDGSLVDGCETATVPIELGYALDGYPFDAIHNVAKKYGMRSHHTDTCGFHIHVNRSSIPDFELTMAKVLLTFDKFYDKLLTFGRRRQKDRPEHWCAKPNADIKKSDTPRELRDKLCVARDHYRAVNMLPMDTVEFRLWKGTHNPDTIRATIDFLSALIDVCAETDLEELYDWTWEEFLNVAAPKWRLEKTREYVISRGLM